MTLRNVLEELLASSFGISMPLLSPAWTSITTPPPLTSDDANLSLTINNGEWVAPIAGTIQVIQSSSDSEMPVTLVQTDGNSMTSDGILLSLFPQAYVRLCRLYAHVLENNPNSDQPIRPVPRYFYYTGSISPDIDTFGFIHPEENIDIDVSTGTPSTLTIYDANGIPIDPLAVASAFHYMFQRDEQYELLFTGTSVLDQIVTGLSAVRVRVSDHAGMPFDNSEVIDSGTINPVNGLTNGIGNGLFDIDLTSGISIDGTLDEEIRRVRKIGASTNGRLGSNFTPPAVPPPIPISFRDFFSVRYVNLEQYLLGEPNVNFRGTQLEHRPIVRINEALSFHMDGNEILGAANKVIADAINASMDESLCVAQKIDTDFAAPENPDNSHWPAFPDPNPPPDPNIDRLPRKIDFEADANWSDAEPKFDVVLTLHNLPYDAAIRVYPRKVITDMREARGDGVGGVVQELANLSDNSTGRITLLLKNPFEFHSTENPKPTDDRAIVLSFDVAIVTRSTALQARIYGGNEIRVTDETTSPSSTDTNNFGNAHFKGICKAGILGFEGKSFSDILDPSDILKNIIVLASNTDYRQAPRFPTMARRDLLVAGKSSVTDWQGVIAGGRLTPETHSANSRLGGPGSPGGRETQIVGISTGDGRLAYDIARMAFRRTTGILGRIGDLLGIGSNRWEIPIEPDEAHGSIAGALLQTVSYFCETPEMELIKSTLDDPSQTIPHQLDQLVPWINSFTQPYLTIAVQGDSIDRLLDELYRELISSCYGRRDAQWALQQAIGDARQFIYIESPGFCNTGVSPPDPPALPDLPPHPNSTADLIQCINDRIIEAPGLHVIICTPKYPDVGPGYESFGFYEAASRKDKIDSLHPERTVAFHPIGFPGRYSRLESTVVIVDDIWAMVGSSTFRRRGLTFDGGSDLVFTDTDLARGRSPAIAEFRRNLMANRLGIKIPGSPSQSRESGYVRLNDGGEAFYLIREILSTGGAGKIEPLWDGTTPGEDGHYEPNLEETVYNPDGFTFNLVEAHANIGGDTPQ
jgi:hypothetical protein